MLNLIINNVGSGENKFLSRMFDLVSDTYNPLGGRCSHECVYCWSMGEGGLVEKYDMKKYQGTIRLIEKEFKRKFKEGVLIFVQDMSDLFANNVPREYVQKVIDYIKQFPNTYFLFMTKNPKRYLEFTFPKNVILGCTMETNVDTSAISKAPIPSQRFEAMASLSHQYKALSCEPIIDFDLEIFIKWLQFIKPVLVWVGYDNYNHRLLEPSLAKVEKFAEEISKFTNVRWKTKRKAWWE